MYRSDRHRQFVHRRRNITSYRGAQTVLRRPVNHRGEHTLPVERIARRPQVDLAVAANITPDHDGAAEGEAFGVRVDDLKAAVAPSLSPPRSASIRSDKYVSLAQRSRFTTCDF